MRLLATKLLVIGLLLASAVAHAGSIEVKRAELALGDEGYVLSAEFALDFSQPLEEAVTHGVPLFFVMDFDLTRARWYWANEHIASRKITYRISYSALTRQYRLSNGSLHRNFATIDEVLRVISRVSDLPVAEKGVLNQGETYQAALRFSLDRSQLPKPFQLDAIANRDWQVDSKTLRWKYTAGMEAK